jgi:carboxymethylenebutenolidase
MRRARISSAPYPAIALLVLASCAGGGDDTGAATPDGAAVEIAGRVPYAPTPPDSLPAAILGTAPPPAGQPVAYASGESATQGYLAVPTGAGPFPAVILIHEWNGLVDRIRQMADALAAEGYVALAADLYSGRTGSSPEANRALVEETLADSGRVVRNLDAAAAYLRGRPDVTGRIAAIGWCFGGGVALSYALGGAEHEGTAIFYGSLLDDPDRLASIHHEVYGTFGAEDTGIPRAAVDRFAAALRQAGVANDIHVYDAVGHGFWLYVDRDMETRRDPALEAWQRLKAYLVRALR